MSASAPNNWLRHRIPKSVFLIGISFLILFVLTLVLSALLPHPTLFQLITFRILLTIDAAWFAMALAPFLPAPFLASGWQVAIPLVQAVVPVLLGALTCAADPPSLVANKPTKTISSVSWNNTTQTVVITGSGFGTQSPYTGDSQFILLHDVDTGWNAGFPGDLVTLNVASWTNTRIVISGFTGLYGRNNWVFRPGDHVVVSVWNANQNPPESPSTFTVIVPGPK
jgi:hypothetical protein